MPLKVLPKWDPKTAWERHCRFLELSIPEFLELQTSLLADHLRRLPSWPLPASIAWRLGAVSPTGLAEFRRSVPLTRRSDYAWMSTPERPRPLPEGAHRWVQAAGGGAVRAWVPYTRRGWARAAETLMAGFLLACARRKGEVNLRPGDWAQYPDSHHAGSLLRLLGFEMSRRFGIGRVFQARQDGQGEDALSSGDGALRMFRRPGLRRRFPGAGSHRRPWALMPAGAAGPGLMVRMASGDGGPQPYRVLASAQGGVMALQGWNRRGLTLAPQSNLFEFIPEEESRRGPSWAAGRPGALLLDELEPNQSYELVITSFHGMPFLRYRTGQLLRVEALEDAQLGSRLPQFSLQGRCDDQMELAGGSLLDEAALEGILANPQLGCAGWMVRTEARQGRLCTHLYGEFRGELTGGEISRLAEDGIRRALGCPREAGGAEVPWPVAVTRLPAGSFAEFRSGTAARGYGQPVRVNPSDAAIAGLLAGARRAGGAVAPAGPPGLRRGHP